MWNISLTKADKRKCRELIHIGLERDGVLGLYLNSLLPSHNAKSGYTIEKREKVIRGLQSHTQTFRSENP